MKVTSNQNKVDYNDEPNILISENVFLVLILNMCLDNTLDFNSAFYQLYIHTLIN